MNSRIYLAEALLAMYKYIQEEIVIPDYEVTETK